MKFSDINSIPVMIFQAIMTLKRKNDATKLLSDDTLICEKVAIDKDHLSEFNKFVGRDNNDIMISYFYFFAQKVQLNYMLRASFPFVVMGLIHTKNTMEYRGEFKTNEEFQLKVKPSLVTVENSRSSRLTFQIDFYQNEKLFLTNTSEYSLQTMQDKKKSIDKSLKKKSHDEVNSEGMSQIEINIANDLGRKYAKLSGDYNPIHIHWIFSKLFGMKRPIIHGMYMAAKSVSEIEKQIEKKVKNFEITFKHPIFLNNKVILLIDSDSNEFKVVDKNLSKLHLSGTFTC